MRLDWTAVATSLVLSLVVTACVAKKAAEGTKVTLAITGMTCGGCAVAIKAQLQKTEGVIAAEVSHAKGEAEVTYDPARTDLAKLKAAVAEAGYEARVKGDAKDGSKTTSEAPAGSRRESAGRAMASPSREVSASAS